MILLDDTHLVRRGTLRSTYRHPADPNLCIKIEDQPARKYRSVLTPWARVEFPSANVREMNGYRHFKRSFPLERPYVSWVGDMVETSLGTGLIVENINPDNRPYYSLKQLAAQRPKDLDFDDVSAQVETLIADFQKYRIRNHCVAPESVMFVWDGTHYRMRITDFKTLAISSWSPFSHGYPWRWPKYFAKRLRSVLARARPPLDAVPQ